MFSIRTDEISYALLEVQKALLAIESFKLSPFELSYVSHSPGNPADVPSTAPPEVHCHELFGTVTRGIA